MSDPTQLALEAAQDAFESHAIASVEQLADKFKTAIEKAKDIGYKRGKNEGWNEGREHERKCSAAHASDPVRIGSVGDMLCEHEDCRELATGLCAKHTPAHASEPWTNGREWTVAVVKRSSKLGEREEIQSDQPFMADHECIRVREVLPAHASEHGADTKRGIAEQILEIIDKYNEAEDVPAVDALRDIEALVR